MILQRVVEVPLGVRVDLGGVDHRPLLGAPGRVADPCCVVPDDQDADVAGVLKGTHPLERDAVAERDVRRGDVDPSLTRNGRPSFSLSSRPPAGRTLTAFLVSSAILTGG